MSKLTVLDLGNYNIKFLGEDAKGIFSSKTSTEFKAFDMVSERIEYKGRKVYVDEGTLSREYNKSIRDNIVEQALYAIAKGNGVDIIDTNLVMLLPANQMTQKDTFINTFKNKTFNCIVNGINKQIIIGNVYVLPEGFSAFYSLNAEERKGDIALLDFGSRTINIALFQNEKMVNLQTIKKGSFDYYNMIMQIENSKGKGYTEDDIQRCINNKSIEVSSTIKDNFIQGCFNNVKGLVDISTYKPYCVGGTSDLLRDAISRYNNKITIVQEAIYANMIGAKNAYELMCK